MLGNEIRNTKFILIFGITLMAAILINDITIDILWFFIMILLVSYLTPKNYDMKRNLNLIVISVLLLWLLNIILTTTYPFKRGIRENATIPKTYKYEAERLYIDTDSPNTIKDITNEIPDKMFNYMLINKCQPVKLNSVFLYWVFSRGETHKWYCLNIIKGN